MARVIVALEELAPAYEPSDLFWFGPRLTVAQIQGGAAINIVPQYCEAGVDLRLVPGQTREGVLSEITARLETVLGQQTVQERVKIQPYQYEPAYASPADSPVIRLLQANAQTVLARPLPLVASGPSNIGNVVGNRQIATVNGFGATAEGVHAFNEYIEIESLGPIAQIYLMTTLDYLAI